MIPIQCFTCGKEISSIYTKFVEACKEEENKAVIFNMLGLKRICCRRMLMGHVDLIDHLMEYDRAKQQDGASNFNS